MIHLLKNTPTKTTNIPASFRDPSGFIFQKKGIIFRQINKQYQKEYEQLMQSGLYATLVSSKLLLPHKEVSEKNTSSGWKIIQPEQLAFISYPYEWSFSMLKDAALVTLQIQKIALQHGMSLKDASAFNIQFVQGKPTLIDTLSLEMYEEGKPWIAYKQFVEHFLAPLALMSMVDVRLNRMSSVFLDGIPVDVAARLLPFKARLNMSLLIHIFAHASTKEKFSDKKLTRKEKAGRVSKQALLGLIDNLEGTIQKLHWHPVGTQWADYYEQDKNNYHSTSLQHKAELVKKFIRKIKPRTVWDLGANTGFFSRIAVGEGASTISFDIDYGALDKNYRDIKKEKASNILPLFLDLTNPTPALGWNNQERDSLMQRKSADTILALALIHHLAISHNLPLAYLASYFAQLGTTLIIEFIPKEDSQIQKLLANREDIFPRYSQKDFEKEFSQFFRIKDSTPIKNSKRTLYFMERK